MIIWTGPALLLAIIGALPAILLGAVFGLEPGAWMFIMSGFAIAGLDISYRTHTEMGFFNLETSTFFFIIPTWVVGAVILLGGLIEAMH